MSVRLPKPERPAPRKANGGTYLAMTFIVICVAAFIALTSLILPQIRGLIIVVIGMCAFIGLHYLTWGRWLTRISNAADDEHDDA